MNASEDVTKQTQDTLKSTLEYLNSITLFFQSTFSLTDANRLHNTPPLALQRTRERRAGKDAHNFRTNRWQVLHRAGKNCVNRAVIHCLARGFFVLF